MRFNKCKIKKENELRIDSQIKRNEIKQKAYYRRDFQLFKLVCNLEI